MLLASSACYKQHFEEWFSVFKCNADLRKLEWTPLLLTSIKSVICQIDVNCSPFQSLNIVLFHIRAEYLKSTYYSLISIFSRYYFETDKVCFFHSSSHVFPDIDFDSNYFGIPLSQIVKPRDHNETKPLKGKIFQKYKLIRHYFSMSKKKLPCSFVNKVYKVNWQL